MALTHPDNIYSPASSLSGSSFSMLTASPLSSDDPFEAIDESSSDEDEVVWTANEFDPDEDFILIPQSHPRPKPNTSVDAPSLHEAFSVLSFHEPTAATPIANTPTLPPHKSKRKPKKASGYKGRRSAGAPSEVSGQLLASIAPKSHRGRRKRGRKDVSTSYPSPSPERDSTGIISPEHDASSKKDFCFGERPIIEESDQESYPVFSKYEDAVCFITSFLSSPSAALTRSTYTRLTFLQSLIIELGLMSPSSALPSSLKSAKHFLKTRAFINIGEYLSAREQGVEKLQQIMFNSRRELTSDLRRKKAGKKADRGWVKRHGLNVLLVTVF
ncbi:hypothetical protein JB92DRAFT_3144549 [Gautieria morchelliformis]|nr:hypothetical protein JB92DRAFT_3144549 [Gautieria morchelliformis]